MDITLERIIEELKLQNKRKIDLTNHLNMVSSAFGNWVSGRNTSYKKYLHAIADFLNVSVEYLKGETDIKKSATAPDSDETLKFALWGGDAEDITPEMLEDVRKFAQFIRQKKKEDGN